MDTPDETGVSLRSKLIQLEEANNIRDPRLEDEVKPMVAGAHLIKWFWEVSGSRQMSSLGMGGGMLASLTYEEIKSWAFLRRISLSPWEVLAIKALDTVYLKHFNKKG